MRVVGFTGTQVGMTTEQRAACRPVLWHFRKQGAVEFHHGDCVGADEQADAIAIDLGYRRHIHPGPDGPKRAHCERRTPGPARVYARDAYMNRNMDIVLAADVLLAAPKAREEQQRSGTWATVRRARRIGIPIWFAWPDGEVSVERAGREG